MNLTSNQLEKYKNNGYVAPLDVLSKKEAKEIRDEIEYIEKKWPNELEGLGRNYVHLISPVFNTSEPPLPNAMWYIPLFSVCQYDIAFAITNAMFPK